ncbi:carboxypeptidase M32 [Stagnihabitans tardus]|uniref:Metal-dependent carboxypeptidase n=1 Tax=Stagnihabitans tardus TaxID=2699202 RepID=A0AAE5BX36_9RHOB|nr:carboxypeptidase M32 [Stagnihabitans tardus]NBZ89524.1 carboxypeptidase M32 [Stagnihabitans tardus]
MNNHAFTDLMAFERETQAIAAVAERLGWDQETMMPRGAAEQRGEEMGAMEGILHARRTDPRIAEWLGAAVAPDAAGEAQLRLIARSHARAVKIPGALAQELARVTSVAQGVWAEARAKEDVAAFLPTLEKVVGLRRQEAACLAEGGDLYDALMDDYEPGATAATIGAMFDRMRPRLVALREKVIGKAAPRVSGHFPAEGQLALAREVAEAYGYDFTRGRIDLAVHPFSSGSGDDSRITTRVVESDPFNCLYSTIHEVGHSSYELNIDRGLKMTPAGRGVSMGVHESQSRIYENQIGRGAMALWLYGRMEARFGALGVSSAQEFLRAVNRVQAGFIRTEADEVHYNLHIMMRFDLERALIRGDLAVGDLEEAWNARFAADFGVKVDKPSNGVLQDVHWSVGLFGYFPTYTLGNVYAGCLWQALRRDLPGVEEALAKGDTSGAVGWLKERLQRHGGLRTPSETIAHACGFAPSEGPLLDYLEAKFSGLYGL